MATVRWTVAALFVLAVVGAGAREDKIDKGKLVGTWTLVKTDAKDAPPPGASIKLTFGKDGKLSMAMAVGDKKAKQTGTYSVKGDQLTTVMKGRDGKDKKETMTIEELTDKRFVTTEKEDGKTVTTEFKK